MGATEPGLTSAEVGARLERLERQARWWRRGAIAMLLAAASVILMGQSSAGYLTTRQLLLVDGAGKRRVELSLNGDSPQLLFFDKKKRVRLQLDLQAGLPRVVFMDAKKRPRAMLSSNAAGDPAWALYDKRRKARATFAMRKDGSTILFFTDKNGKVGSVYPSPSRH